jgi:hypothetical protein
MLHFASSHRGVAFGIAIAVIVCAVSQTAAASNGRMMCAIAGTGIANRDSSILFESFSFSGGSGANTNSGSAIKPKGTAGPRNDVTLTIVKKADASDAALHAWLSDNAEHNCTLIGQAPSAVTGETQDKAFSGPIEYVLTNVTVTKIEANASASATNTTHQVIFRVGILTEKTPPTPAPKSSAESAPTPNPIKVSKPTPTPH